MTTHETATKVRLTELRTNSCRWPLGGIWDVPKFFCGEPIMAGCPYCPEHRQRAFATTKSVPAKVSTKR